MKRMTLTRELIYSAATDAGNRSMRRNNRTAWNAEDYDVAVEKYLRLLKHFAKQEQANEPV